MNSKYPCRPKENPKIALDLLKWYRKNKRDLPWRRLGSPYRTWISEIMLQQTQVQTVIPYFEKWMKTFPDIQTLAQAPLENVLKLWEGLGYYSRARNIHQSARKIMDEFGGKVPSEEKQILSLPGIGRYSSGAILSIAFKKPKPVLDGNVIRVLTRLYAIEADVRLHQTLERLWALADSLLHKKFPGDFNQGMMELGALICKPQKPNCPACPLNSHCKAFKTKEVLRFPVITKREKTEKIRVAAGILWRDKKVFIQRRPLKGRMGGLWEFPGGKIEKDESPEQGLLRELNEELGIQGEILGKRKVILHSYTRFRVELHAFDCRILSGRIRLKAATDKEWVRISDLEKYAFPAANGRLIKEILLSPLP